MKLSAVLPLSVNGTYNSNDLIRSDMLFASLEKYINNNCLSLILVVTPDKDTECVQHYLSKWKTLPIKTISEETLVPELSKYPKVRGWRKQQIVKIAAANYLGTPFYLTLDSDVICTRPLFFNDVIVSGRALMQLQPRHGHKKWWLSSSLLLNMKLSELPHKLGMSVTPVILATPICLGLMDSLQGKHGNSWVDRLCALHNNRDPSNWTLKHYLMRRWTEYSLYYLYAARENLLESFHIETGSEQSSQLISTRAPKNANNFHYLKQFNEHYSAFFHIINSKEYPEPNSVASLLES